jgi:excisionase family DNA binding protein
VRHDLHVHPLQHEAEAPAPQSKIPVVSLTDLPLLMTARDVQALTGLHKDGVYQLLHEAGCPVVRFGRVIRVMRDPFWRWLQERAGAQDKDA